MYSKPRILIFDRGINFTLKEFEEFMKEVKIEYVKIATIHCSSGQIKRYNRILALALGKLYERKEVARILRGNRVRYK